MADNLFRTLQNVFVITYLKGTYKQSEVATRKGELYAKVGGGFLRLSTNGVTSASVKWIEFVGLEKHQFDADSLGRLQLRSDVR